MTFILQPVGQQIARIRRTAVETKAFVVGGNPITFTTVDFDIGGFWSATNPERFTIPNTGTYMTGCWLQMPNAVIWDIHIWKNKISGVGVRIARKYTCRAGVANKQILAHSFSVLTAGDIITPEYGIETAGNYTAGIAPNFPVAWIMRIG
ncbi:MAG TPA: hypothetical protein VJ521_04275 [Acidobacteriota bacterium]|nr:hypothetical protein [Acidobacteriota bacterium]